LFVYNEDCIENSCWNSTRSINSDGGKGMPKLKGKEHARFICTNHSANPTQFDEKQKKLFEENEKGIKKMKQRTAIYSARRIR
jgi:DnaJ-class molecular chaperone